MNFDIADIYAQKIFFIEKNNKDIIYVEYESFWRFLEFLKKAIAEALLTPTLTGFEILNDLISIFLNWLVSRLFENIFHHLNFAEDRKWQFS